MPASPDTDSVNLFIAKVGAERFVEVSIEASARTVQV